MDNRKKMKKIKKTIKQIFIYNLRMKEVNNMNLHKKNWKS
jgi:hypothetical protein